MKKMYRIVVSCILILLLKATDCHAQNSLAAGDIAIASYQSDYDLSNADFGGTTDYVDRFSIVVLKSGGLAAGTVLYFTDRGWNITSDNFDASSEGTIKWTVPAGGISFGTEVFFISHYDIVSFVTTWGAYTTETGTTATGTVTTESGADAMELATGGDQVLVYQTGPTAGPAGTYDNTTRRFITAIHANIVPNVTTYAAWDGSNPAAGGFQSSVPPGLTNGTTAILMSQVSLPSATTGPTEEPDNGKFTGAAIACSTGSLAAIINNSSNWTLQNTAFAIGSSSGLETYTLNTPVTISSQPSPVTTCSGLTATFSATGTGSGTPTYQWQESTDAGFTSPVTLGNTGVYSGVNTTDLTISDNTGLGGRCYRAVVTNTCGSVNSNAVLLTLNASLPTTTTTVTQAVNTNNNLYYSGCALIAQVVPSGASPLTGNVTSEVWVESSVPVHSGQPFVARHYQITSATNAATATGTVTLYFTQAEFNAFNAAAGSTLDLPTGPSDNAGKSNLRIGKYSGSSNNGTGLPASYTSGAMVIDPADANIVWNSTFSRWEITFDVTGFSGFIIQTAASVLPVNLTAFDVQLNNNNALLQWKTASEVNNDYFEIERSTNGQTFTTIGKVTGNNGTGIQNYMFTDKGAGLLTTPKVYYRLKIVSTTGEVEYSNIITLPLSEPASPVVAVTPNPFTSNLKVTVQMPEVARLAIRLSDITGQVLKTEYVKVPKGKSIVHVTGVGNLVQGIYILSVQFNGQVYTHKIVK